MHSVATDTVQLDIALNAAMDADFFSAPIETAYHDNGAMQIVWSGADSDTAVLMPQASIDKINWCDLVTASQAKKVDDVAGSKMYDFTDIGYPWLRMKFSKMLNTTGTLTCTVYLKRRR